MDVSDNGIHVSASIPFLIRFNGWLGAVLSGERVVLFERGCIGMCGLNVCLRWKMSATGLLRWAVSIG